MEQGRLNTVGIIIAVMNFWDVMQVHGVVTVTLSQIRPADVVILANPERLVASPEIMWDPRFALIRRLGAGSNTT